MTGVIKYVDKMASRADKELETQGLDFGGTEALKQLISLEFQKFRGDLGELTQEVKRVDTCLTGIERKLDLMRKQLPSCK